ncbi:MAG TPA: hypothetical protein GX730_07150 [Chloroflexi bacterium]|nr:hypothetical protein [Chloroflexota bacterium]
MEDQSSINGKIEFLDENQESGVVLSKWLKRTGMDQKMVISELMRMNHLVGDIGEKSFKQWTSEGESAKRVSGSSVEIRGERIVTLVEWFFKEHSHRVQPVLNSSELRQLLDLYTDIPVKNRLQLKRLLHDLEIQEGERVADFSFAKDWKSHFASWPVFCFVIDDYYCVRASTSYEMAMAGYTEDDMKHWTWWNRLTASRKGMPKYSLKSPRYSLRGPYSKSYYQMQLNQFYRDTQNFRNNKDLRYEKLMNLLRTTEGFNEMWKSSLEDEQEYQQPFGFPVPFFRQDGTLLWMLELYTIIPHTNNYRLVTWMPLNEDSAEYQGEIRRWADSCDKFSRRAYFIEDFANNFTQEQRFALGVDTPLKNQSHVNYRKG